MTHALIVIVLAAASAGAAGPQHPQHADRATHAMGFDQEKTTHHFYLETNGGAIEVTVKDAADRTSLEQVRTHLRHIATAFSEGDFNLPFLVHATEPPGVDVLKQRRAMVTYRFEELPAGAKVVVRTSDPAARTALHDFLRYQIREHGTGDPLKPRAGVPAPHAK